MIKKHYVYACFNEIIKDFILNLYKFDNMTIPCQAYLILIRFEGVTTIP